MRRADGQNRIGAGDRLIVDQDAAARLSDGHVGSDAHAADRDRLGATGPQRVDHQLQIPIEDDLTAAFDAFLRHVAEILRGAGIGECDSQPRAGDRGGGGGEVGPVKAAEQQSAALIALEPAASLGVDLLRQRIPAGGRDFGRLFGRPHASRKHLLALAHTWRGGLRLRDGHSEHGRDCQGGEHLPARQ